MRERTATARTMVPARPGRINGLGRRRWTFGKALSFLAILLPWAAVAPGAAQLAGSPGALAVAAEVEAHYAALPALRARFEQRFVHRLQQHEDRWRGRLAIRRPSFFRIDYTTPRGRVVVSDGTTISAFDPEPAPGRLWQEAASTDSLSNALALLAGTAHLEAEFELRELDASGMGFRGAVLELRPRAPTPLYERVLFYVDRGEARRGRIHRLLWVDAAGNTNRFDLLDPDERTPVAATFFVFEPPPGAARIEP